MSGIQRIDLGLPALLEFKGPDAVRFLNGQLTQDVRRVVGEDVVLPSCVTDAKGKLQFRIDLTEYGEGVLWVIGGRTSAELLEARITRYLIADDVEVADLTGRYALIHFTGELSETPEGVIRRKSSRYGILGTDCLVPTDREVHFPDYPRLEGDALESFRIHQGTPEWGIDLVEGILPPEAGLEPTDISYQKGCYIGQEVISRIKSAGKVNRKLTLLRVPEQISAPGELIASDGTAAGEITSVSPSAVDGARDAIGYVKRVAAGEALFINAGDGVAYAVSQR